MSKNATLYVDESGDLGYGCGTKWFVLSGAIIASDDERRMRDTISAIRSTLNIREIHWRKIREFDKRAFIIHELAQHPFTYINIIADTSMLDRKKISDPHKVYNYMCRFLIERASWLLRDESYTANIMLAGRGTGKDGELKSYIETHLLNSTDKQIEPRFDSVLVKFASEWDMLQVADTCAASTFAALEPNKYGLCTPCFLQRLKNKLYRHNGKVENYGMKYLDSEMKIAANYYSGKLICRE